MTKRSLTTKMLWKDGKINLSGKNCHLWKGGYSKGKVPLYDTYSQRLIPYEEVRRSTEDENLLEIQCTHCKEWYIPSVDAVVHRIRCINGKSKGEQRFYCSDGCKKLCPIYGAKSKMSIVNKHASYREIQPQLRKMVFERDGYKCVKCDSKISLHCHHIDPLINNPIESADIDNCITLCKEFHKEVHNIPGCTIMELKCSL